MQLMPGTARELAGKLGLTYDSTRLTGDPHYNIMLGSSYFQRTARLITAAIMCWRSRPIMPGRAM